VAQDVAASAVGEGVEQAISFRLVGFIHNHVVVRYRSSAGDGRPR
jgi:hypothetical protein